MRESRSSNVRRTSKPRARASASRIMLAAYSAWSTRRRCCRTMIKRTSWSRLDGEWREQTSRRYHWCDGGNRKQPVRSLVKRCGQPATPAHLLNMVAAVRPWPLRIACVEHHISCRSMVAKWRQTPCTSIPPCLLRTAIPGPLAGRRVVRHARRERRVTIG